MIRVLVCIYILTQMYFMYDFIEHRKMEAARLGIEFRYDARDLIKIIEFITISVSLFVLAKRSREQMLKNRSEDNK